MRKVVQVASREQSAVADLLPSNKNRSSTVHEMQKAYNLRIETVPSTLASADQLKSFHDDEYVKCLLKPRDKDEEEDVKELETFGLLYDCPVFPELATYVRTIAGSTISLAKYLVRNPNCIGINWDGGRHHCSKSKASGFCYVNDIVLGILELRSKYRKIAYIDFDLHHGDGVCNAFKFSDKVMCISVHQYDLGFFPGTGAIDDRGKGKGNGFTVNVPVKHGLQDGDLLKIVEQVFIPKLNEFQPESIVIQCGGDGLVGDEHKEWNLTIKGLSHAINLCVDSFPQVPVMLLGGGGYNHTQMARFWTYLAATVSQSNIDFDIIPDTLDYESEEYKFWYFEQLGHMMQNDNDIDCLLQELQ